MLSEYRIHEIVRRLMCHDVESTSFMYGPLWFTLLFHNISNYLTICIISAWYILISNMSPSEIWAGGQEFAISWPLQITCDNITPYKLIGYHALVIPLPRPMFNRYHPCVWYDIDHFRCKHARIYCLYSAQKHDEIQKMMLCIYPNKKSGPGEIRTHDLRHVKATS